MILEAALPTYPLVLIYPQNYLAMTISEAVARMKEWKMIVVSKFVPLV